jgi:uncharacterized membrane protein YvlD (DUF360 family)
MKGETFFQKIRQQVKPMAIASWDFLKRTFSDKKNIIRFSLAALAIVVTDQLFPSGKVVIAGFGVTLFIILTQVALMISATHVLKKIKLPFNLYSYGAYLWIAFTLLLFLYDWMLWYFETSNDYWVALYSLIIAFFNCIIENLLQDDLH